MKYPYYSNLITLEYQDDSMEVKIIDSGANDEKYAPMRDVRFAQMLDGKTDPFELLMGRDDDEVLDYLSHLHELGLIRMDRGYSECGKGTVLKGFMFIYDNDYMSNGLKSWSRVLRKIYIPAFLLGIALFIFFCLNYQSIKGTWLLLFLGLLFGHFLGALLSIFELVVTAIDIGAKAMELGVKLFPIVEAYSYVDYKKCKEGDRDKAEFSGIKAYMLLAGVFMVFYYMSYFNIFFLIAAGINFLKVFTECVCVMIDVCYNFVLKVFSGKQ